MMLAGGGWGKEKAPLNGAGAIQGFVGIATDVMVLDSLQKYSLRCLK